jgi:CYTH domain-containing protein
VRWVYDCTFGGADVELVFDVFESHLRGIIVAHFIFNSQEESDAFWPPPWLVYEAEMAGDEGRYFRHVFPNHLLSRKGEQALV